MTFPKIWSWTVLAAASWVAVGCGGGGGSSPLADLGTSSSSGVSLSVEQTPFAAGAGYSLVQRTNGTVATIGSGSAGSSNTLIQNRALSVALWAEGRGASFAVDESGGIRYWGYDRTGTISGTPRLLSGLGKSVAVRACGTGNAAMVYSLRSDGSIWAIPGTSISERAQGFPVTGIDNVVALSDGGDDGCTGMLAIKKDGTVSQLAARASLTDPTGIPDTATAVGILGVLDAVQASCARDNCLAVTKSGEVYGWGSNTSAQLGMGDKTPRWTPVNTKIDEQTGPIQQVFVSMSGAAYAVTRSGALYGWGSLDVNDEGAKQAPVEILSSGVVKVSSSPALSGHTLVQMADGRVLGWGRNDRGQIDASGASVIKTPTELAVRVK